MLRDVRISGGLFACLMIAFMHSATLLFVPAVMTEHAGADAWMAVLPGGVFGGLVASLAAWVSLRHPGKSPVQIAQLLLGKWLGGLVGLVYLGFFTWLFSLVLRNVLDFAVIVLLPGTPGRVIVALMAAITLYGVWKGLEPAARVAFQTLAAISGSLVVMPLLLWREFSQLHISLPFEHGVMPVFLAAMHTLSWFGEAFVVMTLVPHLKHPRHAYKWIWISTGVATLFLTQLVALCILVFGPVLPSRFLFPTYELIKMVSLARFFERVEMFLILVWLSGMFVKLSVCLYAASEAAKHVFGVRSHRWPGLILAIVGGALTHVWSRTVDEVAWGSSLLLLVQHVPIEVGVPGLLLLASLVRAGLRKGEAHNAS